MVPYEWQVKLCDPVLTRAIPERLRDKQLIIKRYTNEAYFTFLLYYVGYLKCVKPLGGRAGGEGARRPSPKPTTALGPSGPGLRSFGLCTIRTPLPL